MEQREINRITAAKVAIKYCEDTAAATASNTLFAPRVAYIKGQITIVEGFIQISDTPIKGVKVSVDAIRKVMIERVLPITDQVFAYASTQTPPDQTLMAQSKMAKSQLEVMSKQKCATECRRLITLAQANAANIAPMGITPLMLTDASNAVTLFEGSFGDPSLAIAHRETNLKYALEGLDQIMNFYLPKQLDPLANAFRFSNPVWHTEYRLNREIKDLGHTFTKLRVDTHDIEGDPIKNVLVSLLQAGEVKYTGKTDAGGELSIVKVEPGNYDIKYEKTGYVTQIEVDYHFNPGSEKIHHIVMNETAASGGDPAGFEIQELHIPGGASMQIPVGAPINPAMVLYLFAVNGNISVCTTNIPASPCVVGYNLQQGSPFQGPVSGLNIDLNNSHFQFTNPGANEVTLKVGTQI